MKHIFYGNIGKWIRRTILFLLDILIACCALQLATLLALD